MLDLSVKDYVRVSRQARKTTFFDRGIPDALAYAHFENLPISKCLQSYANQYRYNTMVFIFPPWEKIYKTDTERRQSFDEVVKTHEIMLKTYENCGYMPKTLPKTTVERRSEFILDSINK